MHTTFTIIAILVSINGFLSLLYTPSRPGTNSKIKIIEFEINLFLFKIRKIRKFINMYCKWSVFVSKKVRSSYYNKGS
jgi:hypothetical protein